MHHRMNLSKELTLMSDFCQYENCLMERSSDRDRMQQLRHLNPIQYVQEHYFHYDAKRATDALATGRGRLKGATGTDWMGDPYIHDS